jgi:hypothetical protein
MRTFVFGLLSIVLAVTSCASPSQIAETAQGHEQAAQQAMASGDYATAAAEQRAATKQWHKAQSRARVWYGEPAVVYENTQ